jgi:hypothetical protein
MAAESEKKTNAEKKVDTGRTGLPFEPRRDKKSGQKSNPKSNPKNSAKNTQLKEGRKREPAESTSQVSARAKAKADEILAGSAAKNKTKTKDKSASRRKGQSSAIPEAVSRRMLRRMAVLSGAPVFLGVGIFFLSYYVQSRGIVELPPIAVLLVTMGCFGLGVLGLSYGVISASWDDEPGSLIGLNEFKLNFGRIRESRRAAKD